jgi:hypothetical protein
LSTFALQSHIVAYMRSVEGMLSHRLATAYPNCYSYGHGHGDGLPDVLHNAQSHGLHQHLGDCNAHDNLIPEYHPDGHPNSSQRTALIPLHNEEKKRSDAWMPIV